MPGRSYKRCAVYLLTAGVFLYTTITSAQPVIQSFSPLSGHTGSIVTINGLNFNPVTADNIVRFGGTKAPVIAAGTNFLTVQVPAGAVSKSITVTTNSGTAYSSTAFQLTFPGGGMLFSEGFFAPRVNYSGGFLPISLRVTDLDDDGKPDLIWLSPVSSTVYIRRNLGFPGTIALAPPVSFILPGVLSVQAGDFDGDGMPDLCFIRETGLNDTAVIFRNFSTPGSIQFQPAGSFVTGPNYVSCCVGDIDGDGRPDLAFVSSQDTAVFVHRNTGSGPVISFAAGLRFLTRINPTEASICDVNGDDKPDLIAVNANGVRNSCVSVFGNNSIPGAINLAGRADYLADNGIASLQTADMNGDSKPDVITGGGGLNRNLTLRNTSAGAGISFDGKIIDAGFILNGLQVGDLNGDGLPDVAGSSIPDSSVTVLRNMCTSAGINLPPKTVAYPSGRLSVDLWTADMDGDGRPDLVSCNRQSQTISILRSLAPACHFNINRFPYLEDFETSDGHWFSGGMEAEWEWSSPAKPGLNSAGSGVKCWMTSSATMANYLPGQGSWLRSPCFDFSTLQNPEISFKLFWDTERNTDGVNFQYSLDSGITWLSVGRAGLSNQCSSFNWYNSTNIPSLNNQDGWSGSQSNQPGGCSAGGGGGSGGWLPVKHNLGFLAGQSKIIFRFYFGSNSSCNDWNGFAVDDIRIGEPVLSKVFLGRDTTLCQGETLVLDPGPFASYLWQDNSTRPTFTVSQPGIYQVRVTDPFNCESSDSIRVSYDCNDIYFASAFTPNNDGKNDRFGPLGNIARVSGYSLAVYDRWGQPVFRSLSPFEKWDGRLRGLPMNSQTFVWYAAFTFLDKEYTRKGTVTLIR